MHKPSELLHVARIEGSLSIPHATAANFMVKRSFWGNPTTDGGAGEVVEDESEDDSNEDEGGDDGNDSLVVMMVMMVMMAMMV